jgi:hypothetical protein
MNEDWQKEHWQNIKKYGQDYMAKRAYWKDRYNLPDDFIARSNMLPSWIDNMGFPHYSQLT